MIVFQKLLVKPKSNLLKRRGVNRMGKKPRPDFESKVSLKINDISIELNEFTEDIIKEVSFGMVRAIKTANLEIRNLKIEIDNEK